VTTRRIFCIVKGGRLVAESYSASTSAMNVANARYAADSQEKGFVFLASSPGFVKT
jgi:hypothetical protein